MNDAKDFHSRVRRSDEGATQIEATSDEATKVSFAKLKANVVEFGPGTFEVSMRHFRSQEAIEFLEIRGAGMDETTLVMDGELLVTFALEHLYVRDVTLEYGHRSEALDVRERAAARFERVRIRDWASGGYGAAIGIAGQGYLSCEDCVFEDADGVGGKIGVNFRGPALAVLERCAFIGVQPAITATRDGRGGRIRLIDCTFEEASLANGHVLDKDKRALVEIRVEGAHATFGAPSLTPDQRRQRWGEPFASVSNLTLGPSIRVVTVANLVEVLRSVQFPSNEALFSVALSGWAGREPTSFRASTQIDGNPRGKLYSILRIDGSWVLRHEPRGGGPSYWAWPDLPQPMDLLTALERSDVPRDALANSVWFQRAGSAQVPEKRRQAYVVNSASDGLLFDARTGETLSQEDLQGR